MDKIVIIGGNSCLKNFEDKLKTELNDLWLKNGNKV